jgi:hypothetical protein
MVSGSDVRIALGSFPEANVPLPTTRELVHERAYRTQVTLIDPGGRVDFVTGP